MKQQPANRPDGILRLRFFVISAREIYGWPAKLPSIYLVHLKPAALCAAFASLKLIIILMSFASVLRGVCAEERETILSPGSGVLHASICGVYWFNTPTCIIFACSSVMEKHSYCSGFQNYIIYEADNANYVYITIHCGCWIVHIVIDIRAI